MLKALLSKLWKWITMIENAAMRFACHLIETIPPRDLTATRLGITEERIRAYWKIHGYLPSHLGDLPILKGRDNATSDGWGRTIKYDVTGTSTVILSSLGPEGAVNGTGLNQGIQVTFDANKEMTP
jgi:hypothetical protein